MDPQPAPAAEPTPLAVPAQRFGKYEVLSTLGKGGSGVVFRVRNPDLTRIEALKLLRLEDVGGPEDFLRFQREARILAQLNHPNIVPIYEVGTHEGIPYYTMECVDGDTAADIVKRMGALPPRAAMILGRDVALALAAAHERGVIHRDVKPHNILVAPLESDPGRSDGESTLRLSRCLATRFRVLLTDFGLARVLGEQSLTMESGTIAGTLPYMSPEQINAERKRVNEKSDLYSLGVTLYQMLAGRLPFSSETVLALQVAITCDDPPPLRTVRPGISGDVETIVAKCLEKDQNRRYADARELAEDIERYLKGEEIRARPASVAVRAIRFVHRHRTLALSMAGALALSLFFVFLFAIWPGLRERQRDRAALRAVLAQKRAQEQSFQKLLERGDYDAALTLADPLFLARPSLPKLRNPDRAEEPEFRELRSPYRFDVPSAYLRRGQRRLATGDPLGRSDLANAHRTALLLGEETTGRDALVSLGTALEAEGDLAAALAIYRVAAARFVPTNDLSSRLARALERGGHLEEAAARWSRMAQDPEATEALDRLRILLPRRLFPFTPGRLHAEDVDGDGKAEILRVTEEGALSVFGYALGAIVERGRLQLPYANPRWAIGVFDVDRDGRREIVVGTGEPGAREGRLYIIEWTPEGPVLTASDESLKSFCSDFAVSDVDGDGFQELFAATGYFERSIRMYRYRDRKLQRVKEWPMGTDPEFLRLDRRHLVVHFGPWQPEVRFRAALLTMATEDEWILRTATADRFHASAWKWIDDKTVLLATFRDPKETAVMPEMASPGLYRLVVSDGAFSGLQRLHGPWPDSSRAVSLGTIDLGGETCAVAGVDSTIHLVPLSGRPAKSFATSRPVAALATADLDGDREPEILFLQNDLLEVWGMGDPATVPALFESPPPTLGIGTRSAGEDMLEARLFPEAEHLFRESLKGNLEDAGAHYGLGLALSGQSRFREAAASFSEAMKSAPLAVDAGLRRAHAFEEAQDWGALAEAVAALEAMPNLDRFAANEVRRWREWIVPAASLHPRVFVSEWKAGLPLLCESPFEARIQNGRLELWDNADRPGATGVALHYDGGPLRLRLQVQVEEPDWESGTRLGLHGAASLGRPQREAEPRALALFLYYGAEGASDVPVRALRWLALDRAGLTTRRDIACGRALLDPSREHTIEIEYIPGLDRVFVTARDVEKKNAFAPIRMEVPFRLERGWYQVGGVRETLKTVGHADRRACGRIRSLEVEAATPATRLLRPPNPSARESLLLANGDLVLGAWTEAAAGYDAAIRRAAEERDDHTGWRAHLFRALLRLRMQRPEAAGEDVRLAIARSGGEAERLLKGASPALGEDERKRLIEFAGE